MGNLVVAFFIVCYVVYSVIAYLIREESTEESEFAKEGRMEEEWAEGLAAACHEAERERMVPIQGPDGKTYYVERE